MTFVFFSLLILVLCFLIAIGLHWQKETICCCYCCGISFAVFNLLQERKELTLINKGKSSSFCLVVDLIRWNFSNVDLILICADLLTNQSFIEIKKVDCHSARLNYDNHLLFSIPSLFSSFKRSQLIPMILNKRQECALAHWKRNLKF